MSAQAPEKSETKAEGKPERPLWKKPSFWIITFIVLGVIGSFGDEEPTTKDQPAVQSDQSASDTSGQTEDSKPSEQISPRAELTSLMRETFSGTTNMDKPRLRSVDVIKQIGGGWGVFVEFNADDNLTTGMIKGGIETDMQEAYKALYTSNLKVRQASMGAFYPLIDQYGNEEQGLIYKTILSKKVADRINWANADFLEWDNLWNVTFQNVEFASE